MSNLAKSLSIAVMLLVMTIAGIVGFSMHNQRQRELIAAYRSVHKCVRTGFAGMYARPTYVCDTGFIIETEMVDLAKEEGLQ